MSACEVWWARRASYPAALDWLDADERARRDAYVREPDRERFTVGCLITRAVLGRWLAIAPARVQLDRSCGECGRAHGKVREMTGSVELSVTHAGDRVAVAVCAEAAVGIDVEPLDRRLDLAALNRIALHADEPPAADRRALLTYWVRKEALLKLVGTGLRIAPAELAVSAPDQPPRVLRSCAGVPDSAQLVDLAPAGYVGAVATSARCEVVERDAEPLLSP